MSYMIQAFDELVRDKIIRPMIARFIDECYARGDLPLPPLGWGRTEIWYVGDLA